MEKSEKGPVPPDGGYGWVIVGAIILINSTLLTLVQCFGIIFGKEFSQLGITSAEKSFLLHFHSSLYCSFGFFCSPLLKKHGFRPAAFVGASLMCFGILLTSFANSYLALIFTVSIIIGLGQGIVMPATYLAQYTYFKKRLTIAVSVSVTGASISPIIMPRICVFLLSKTNRTFTVLILFAISLLSLVGCFLLKPIKTSKKDEVCLDTLKEKPCDKLLTNDVYKDTTVPIKKENIWNKLYAMFDLQLLKDTAYVVTVIGMGVSFASELYVILMLQFILPKLADFSETDVANAVSVQFAADIVGRLAVPFLAHLGNVHPKVVYAGALLVATIGRTVLAVWSKKQLLVYFACALIGLTKGARAVFQSVIIPRLVPLEKMPAANGLNMLFTGVVSLILGPIIGAVRDVNHSDEYALHMASGLSIMCVILWGCQVLFMKNKGGSIEE